MPRAERFLRTSLLVVRYRDGFVLIHPGSSVTLLTDGLGAQVAKRLIRGQSERTVHSWLETQPSGLKAGVRFEKLVDRLQSLGAITTEPPRHTAKWRLRSWLSLLAGSSLTPVSLLAPVIPLRILRFALDVLPHTPLVSRTVGQIQNFVDANLRASGYADKSDAWRGGIIRGCAAANAQTFMFMYLALNLSPARLAALTRTIYDMRSIALLDRTLSDAGGGVLASLHTALYPAAMLLLGEAGWEASAIANIASLGNRIGSDEPVGMDSYGRYAHIVDNRTRMAGKVLLNRLRAGKMAVVVFDSPPPDTTITASSPAIEFLGRRVYRFDGAAWLAVHSDKPIIFAASYRAGNQSVAYIRPPLYPVMELPPRARIQDLTARLYAEAETFLREHPEVWIGWCYMHDLVVPDENHSEHGESADEMVLATT